MLKYAKIENDKRKQRLAIKAKMPKLFHYELMIKGQVEPIHMKIVALNNDDAEGNMLKLCMANFGKYPYSVTGISVVSDDINYITEDAKNSFSTDNKKGWGSKWAQK